MSYSNEDKTHLLNALADCPLLPYVKVQRSTLGGEERATLIVTVSLDASETWSYGIFENSRYAKFHLVNGSLELFTGGGWSKFRKQKAASINVAAAKIIKWASEAQTTFNS